MCARQNWMTNLYRMLHLDYHQPPWMRGVGAEIDEDKARLQARMFKDAGVQAVEIFAYDHYGQCFYPSEVGIRHPGLAADYTGLMARALKAEGLKVILYVNVYSSVHLHKDHPDWFVKAADGTYPRGGWLQHEASHICASSPYLESYFVPLLQEVVRRHDPDAVWLDTGCWMIETLCYCDHCASAFKAASGHDLPQGPMPDAQEELDRPEWVRWHLWRRGQIRTYVETAVAAVRAANASVLVADNNLGRFSTGVPAVKDGTLVTWLQPSDLDVDYLSCDPVPMGGNHELIFSVEARYQWTTGLPFNYMNERFNGWGEWQFRSPTDWLLEADTVLANGGRAFFADQPYTEGSLEPTVYRDLTGVYEQVAAIEPYLRDAEPVSDVAILASLASNVLGPPGGAEWGRRLSLHDHDIPLTAGDRTDRVRGAHLAFVEGGIQALIYDEATLRDRLAAQSTVVVAEQCLLEDATIEALDSYVSNGGRLLVTGRSGLWDAAGQRRNKDPLRDVLGLERTDVLPAPIHYLRMNKDWLAIAGLDDVPLQVWGAATVIALNGAEPLGTLYEPRADVWKDGIRDKAHWQHYTVFGATPPAKTAAGIGITVHRYGQGTALYVNVDPFALYYREGHQLTRKFILACMNHLAPVETRMLAATKPLHVEVVMARQDGRILVHVLNYFAQKRVGILVNNEEVTPVHDIVVQAKIGAAPKRVSLASTGETLDYTLEGAWASIRLARLDVHALIVIES